MKFLKIENKILNVEQIRCVTENQVYVGKAQGLNEYKIKGIRVEMIGWSEDSYLVFENETVESFYEKLVAA